MKISAVTGMKDILPTESSRWEEVEKKARQFFQTYGYQEIRTPLVEGRELFVRTVGQTTDVVAKQMYVFEDQNGKALCLRPEATASVVRAYVEAALYSREPIAKLYYLGPMFRYERPQKGRQRQFYQIGAELIGVQEALADAELILMLLGFLEGLKVGELSVVINSLGCSECRPAYQKTLQGFLKNKQGALCEDCQKRSERNPLRVLDCKKEKCRQLFDDVPLIHDYWCAPCLKHYEEVCGLLRVAQVSFQEDRKIVRGLDYYCRTAFEVTSKKLGAQDAVAAGGRYDGLVKDLGGPDLAGVGFAIGMERLMLLAGEAMKVQTTPPIFFALLGFEAQRKVVPLLQELRGKGIVVEAGFSGSLKSQMRRAGKMKAERVVILGDEEVKKEIAVVKSMATGEQKEIPLDRLVGHLS